MGQVIGNLNGLWRLSHILIFVFYASVASAQDSETSRLDTARELFAEGQLDQALEQLDNIENDFSGRTRGEAYLLIGQVYIEKGAGIAAQVAIENARAQGVEFSKTILDLSKALLLQRKYADVVGLLRGAEFPADKRATALTILADANLGLNRVDEARQLYALADQSAGVDHRPSLGLARIALKKQDLTVAEKHLKRALELAPRDSMVLYTSGMLARSRGKIDGAKQLFSRALIANPANIWARLELAGFAIDSGDIEVAELHLDQVYAQSPRHPIALYLSAVLAARQGLFEDARTMLLKAGRLVDNYLPALYVRAFVELELDNASQAKNDFEKILSVRPGLRPARLGLAIAYMRLQDYVRALDVVEDLANKSQVDTIALPIAAAAASALGRVEASRHWLSRLPESGADQPLSLSELKTKTALLAYAQEKVPQFSVEGQISANNPGADIRYLAVLAAMNLRAKKLAEASKLIDTLFEIAPERALSYNMKGTLLFQQGRFREAIVAYDGAISRNPAYVTARRNRSLASIELGNYESAITDLRRVLDEIPDDIRSMAVFAKVLLEDAQYSEAIAYFSQVKRVRPDDAALNVDFARALVGARRYTEAASLLDETYRLIRTDQSLVKKVGEIYLQMKDYGEAARILSRLVAFQPEDAQSYIIYGKAQNGAGLYEGARRSYATALTFAGESDKAQINWRLAQTYFQLSRYSDAFDLLSKLDDHSRPADVPASLRARILYAAGYKTEAFKLIEVIPYQNDEDLARALSEFYKAEGDLTRAAQVMQVFNASGNASGDLSLEGRLYYGDLLVEAGRFHEAATQYEAILQQGRISAGLNARLANAYFEIGDARSIQYAEDAYKLLPNSPLVLNIYGWIKLQSERNAVEAIDAFERAKIRAPKDGTIHYRLAMAYLADGSKAQARLNFNEALNLGVSDDISALIDQQLQQISDIQ